LEFENGFAPALSLANIGRQATGSITEEVPVLGNQEVFAGIVKSSSKTDLLQLFSDQEEIHSDALQTRMQKIAANLLIY
jgi:hypothetical protein